MICATGLAAIAVPPESTVLAVIVLDLLIGAVAFGLRGGAGA